MTWTPTDQQRCAKMDPEAQPAVEAEARVRAAVVLLEHWLNSRDVVLLSAARDMVDIAEWWQQE